MLATASDDDLRALAETLPLPVSVSRLWSDEAFRFVGLNRLHQSLSGFGLSLVEGRRPEDLLNPVDGFKVTAQYAVATQARRTGRYRETMALPVGRRDWVTSATPLEGPGGAVVMIAASAPVPPADGGSAERRCLLYDALRDAEAAVGRGGRPGDRDERSLRCEVLRTAVLALTSAAPSDRRG